MALLGGHVSQHRAEDQNTQHGDEYAQQSGEYAAGVPADISAEQGDKQHVGVGRGLGEGNLELRIAQPMLLMFQGNPPNKPPEPEVEFS